MCLLYAQSHYTSQNSLLSMVCIEINGHNSTMTPNNVVFATCKQNKNTFSLRTALFPTLNINIYNHCESEYLMKIYMMSWKA